jgi:hypothetical protein
MEDKILSREEQIVFIEYGDGSPCIMNHVTLQHIAIPMQVGSDGSMSCCTSATYY